MEGKQVFEKRCLQGAKAQRFQSRWRVGRPEEDGNKTEEIKRREEKRKRTREKITLKAG